MDFGTAYLIFSSFYDSRPLYDLLQTSVTWRCRPRSFYSTDVRCRTWGHMRTNPKVYTDPVNAPIPQLYQVAWRSPRKEEKRKEETRKEEMVTEEKRVGMRVDRTRGKERSGVERGIAYSRGRRVVLPSTASDKKYLSKDVSCWKCIIKQPI